MSVNDNSGGSNDEKCVGGEVQDSFVNDIAESKSTKQNNEESTKATETVDITNNDSNKVKRTTDHEETESNVNLESKNDSNAFGKEISKTASCAASNDNDSDDQKSSSQNRDSLTDVITADSASKKNANIVQPRGILKNSRSLPVLTVSETLRESHPKFFQHAFSSGLLDTRRNGNKSLFQKRNFASITSEPPISSSGHYRSTQEFVNPAFELDENVPSGSRLADIVEQVLSSPPDQQRYVHPFGMRNLYATVFHGDQSKIQNTGRLVFWFMFTIMLVGLAGAIILMSEMYKYQSSSTNTTRAR